ncbi:DUF397 domain-containing protein [Micromonospora sp. ATA32]|nr:DUF397 domain-containing protein [Micromonospora sp. ATA32]
MRGVTWRKSTRSSGGGSGDCVEVAIDGSMVAVRDSKDRAGGTLAFSAATWHRFVASLQADGSRR